jgi:butyryl-CoA dehydrogenase
MTVLQEKLLPTLAFLLRDWLDLETLLTRPRYRDCDIEGIADLLHAASVIAAERFEPANRVIDDHEPQVVDGRVVLPEVSQQAWNAYVDFGLLSAAQDREHGCLQSPAMLTEANASLLLIHGNKAQRDIFAARE